MTNITLIGCGKLGSSILKGLLRQSDTYALTVYDENKSAYDHTLSCRFASTLEESATVASVIILCVKPIHAVSVLEKLKYILQPQQFLCSTVMGLSIAEIRNSIGEHASVVRIMPNIACAVGKSATCYCFEKEPEQKMVGVLLHLGTACAVDEKLMNAATVISGSGIAFAFTYIRAMQQAGIMAGFDAKTSLMLSAQVADAAVALLKENGSHPGVLTDQVTTPGGCTIEGLRVMERFGFSSAVMEGVHAAVGRIA